MGDIGTRPTGRKARIRIRPEDLVRPGQLDRALADARERRAAVLAERASPEPQALSCPWLDEAVDAVGLVDEAILSDVSAPAGLHPEPDAGVTCLSDRPSRLNLSVTAEADIVEADAPETSPTTAVFVRDPKTIAELDPEPLITSESVEVASAVPSPAEPDGTSQTRSDIGLTGATVAGSVHLLTNEPTSRDEEESGEYWKTGDPPTWRARRVATFASAAISFSAVLLLGTILGGSDNVAGQQNTVVSGAFPADDRERQDTIVLSALPSEPAKADAGDTDLSAVDSPNIPALAAPPAEATDLVYASLSPVDRADHSAMALPAEPDEGIVQARIALHAPDGLDRNVVGDMAGAIAEAGFEVSRIGRPEFNVSRSHIRYYHASDRPAAQALAQVVGGEARDFTEFTPRPDAGLIEVWLAGRTVQPAATSVRHTADRSAAIERTVANVLSANGG